MSFLKAMNDWYKQGLRGALPVTTDASGGVVVLRNAQSRFFRDVPNYTNYGTDGTVALAEIVTATFSHNANVVIIDPIDVGGNCKGVFVTLNSLDDAQALARLANTNDGTTDDQRRWCPAGTATILGPTGTTEITRVDVVAIDSDASPSNGVSITAG